MFTSDEYTLFKSQENFSLPDELPPLVALKAEERLRKVQRQLEEV